MDKKKEIVVGLPHASREQIIEIQAEAYYRALKRVEEEKKQENLGLHSKPNLKWYKIILYLINVMVFPWKLIKMYKLKERAHDLLLVMVVSLALEIVGACLWAFGIIVVGSRVISMIMTYQYIVFDWTCLVGGLMWLFGSITVLAGKTFAKESDGDRIYAFSACMLAVFSCILSVVAWFV